MRFHERARSHEPQATYVAVRLLTSMWVRTVLRARASGAHRVPTRGAVIVAPNHASFLDHFIVGAFVPRRLQFMAKSQMFQPPGEILYSRVGAFPVRRGLKDEAALATAAAILAREGALVMYCEGTRVVDGRTPARPRPGIGRIALESGAVVVPVAIHGSDRIRNWRQGEFPRVRLLMGEPMQWEPIGNPDGPTQVQVAEAIHARILELYRALDAGDVQVFDAAAWRSKPRRLDSSP